MKILAIDQSYTSSGIVVFDEQTVVHFERFTTSSNLDMYERAWEAASYMRKIARKYTPGCVALEGLAFSKFGNATRDLAGLQYTIVNTLKHLDGYRVVIIPPNTVKKVATGKGNVKKEKLLEALPKDIREKFELSGAKKTKGLYDLTDAYWIGQAAIKII